jgi:hypothetical protein
MPDWNEIVTAYFRAAFNDGDFRLVVNPPAASAEIHFLQQALQFTFPDDWQSLYHAMNGFDIIRDPPARHLGYHLFPPVNRMLEFVNAIRANLEGTHSKLSQQFVPVIDFATGDAVGYRKDAEAGSLHMFCISSYQQTCSQPSEEFLIEIEVDPPGLEGFLPH